MPGELILLVDREPSVIQLGRLYLEREGYCVAAAADGQTALDIVARDLPSVIVTDLVLSKIDGFELCRRLRAEGNAAAIIMLTARNGDIDKVLALELGADDYLTKPFNPRELVARIKAILRRSERSVKVEPAGLLSLGDLTIDAASREVHLAGQVLELRAQEFNLLLTLAGHRGLVLTREQLLQLAWGLDFDGQTRTVDVHVAHLRKKIQRSRVRIETVTGIGYKLIA